MINIEASGKTHTLSDESWRFIVDFLFQKIDNHELHQLLVTMYQDNGEKMSKEIIDLIYSARTWDHLF